MYAESRPADPLGKLGKSFADFDTQVAARDFDKVILRKGGDLLRFEDSP